MSDTTARQGRLLMAVVLSMGVVFLFQWLAPKPAEPPRIPEGAVASPGSSVPREVRPGKAAEPAAFPPRAGRRVHVRTPLVTVDLSTVGGGATSWKLNHYTDGTLRGLELLPSMDQSQSLELCVNGYSDQEVLYAASVDALTLSAGQPGSVVFSGTLPSGIQVAKTLSFPAQGYVCELHVRITNPAAKAVSGPVELIWRRPMPLQTPDVLEARAMVLDVVSTHAVETLRTPVSMDGVVRWGALAQPFAVAALVPRWQGLSRLSMRMEDLEDPSQLGMAGVTLIGVGVAIPSLTLAGHTSTDLSWHVFAGPQTYRDLTSADAMLEHVLHYGWFSWLGLWLLMGLNVMYAISNNYGVAIILLTIVAKLVLWWPSQISYRSMKRMQALQPKMEELKVRYKAHPQQLQQEMMKLYREHKVNPLGGCLPMLVQIPIFFALYSLLQNAAELQGAPFVGWIHDLSRADPYYVLPLFMGVTMFIQQLMTPTTDPTQAKIMLIMPVVFTFMFISLPSGVVLYWTAQNILSIAQQYWVLKHA